MRPILFGLLAILLAAGCAKPGTAVDPAPAASSFIAYTIPAGSHYCLTNTYRAESRSVLHFAVRFDSSAVYRTASLENQYDINKLYGFSDNGSDHHQYSARYGWRWSDGALRLFAYVYNAGLMDYRELASVNIGDTADCSIGVLPGLYRFTTNGQVVDLPRSARTETVQGYRLYPYFGGNEPAPHEVRILIRELD